MIESGVQTGVGEFFHMPSEAFDQAASIGNVTITSEIRAFVKMVLGEDSGFVSYVTQMVYDSEGNQLGDTMICICIEKNVSGEWRLYGTLSIE
jgi:hypothetical protein